MSEGHVQIAGSNGGEEITTHNSSAWKYHSSTTSGHSNPGPHRQGRGSQEHNLVWGLAIKNRSINLGLKALTPSKEFKRWVPCLQKILCLAWASVEHTTSTLGSSDHHGVKPTDGDWQNGMKKARALKIEDYRSNLVRHAQVHHGVTFQSKPYHLAEVYVLSPYLFEHANESTFFFKASPNRRLLRAEPVTAIRSSPQFPVRALAQKYRSSKAVSHSEWRAYISCLI